MIKDRVQVKNPVTNKWVKIDTEHGGIIGHKTDHKPYRNIPTIDDYRKNHPSIEELEKIPVFLNSTTIKYARDNIQCDCGHYARDHYLKEGQCKQCGCTWYYPNYKWIMKHRRKAYLTKQG